MRGTSLCRQFHASSYLTSITEAELDQLVAGCGRKTATFLQLLKETAARCGEACQLEWTDIDFRNNTLTITPEKGSNPRQFKVSGKLIAMLNKLPKTSQKVFGDGLLNHFRKNFIMQRKKVATKLQNPRLDRIHFHTLRHWSATMLFHKTKSLPLVKERLGHRRLDSTLIYTHMVSFEADEYHHATSKTVKEACELIDAGFEYVTEQDGIKLWRKRK